MAQRGVWVSRRCRGLPVLGTPTLYNCYNFLQFFPLKVIGRRAKKNRYPESQTNFGFAPGTEFASFLHSFTDVFDKFLENLRKAENFSFSGKKRTEVTEPEPRSSESRVQVVQTEFLYESHLGSAALHIVIA